METTVPVSYSYPTHDLRALEPRRYLSSHHEPEVPLWSSSPVGFAPPLASSYGAGHAIHGYSHTYQQFLGGSSGAPPIQPLRQPTSTTMLPMGEAHERLPKPPQQQTVPHQENPASQYRPGPQAVKFPASTEVVKRESLPCAPTARVGQADFSTDVDILMKTIQSKTRPDTQLPSLQQFSQVQNGLPVTSTYSIPAVGSRLLNTTAASKSKRKHQCPLPGCGKLFTQKTHLEIHMRAHTGDKPFMCREPGCGQRFTQLGNLKTHERRHTGEKPFSCDICHKRFAQRCNVRAHKVTHEQAKPYTCQLENCCKQFTQLGNLKSHQNKFHATTLRQLAARFASVADPSMLAPEERNLWAYFAELYKHSNKGIKGRGKDRRVAIRSKPNNSDGGPSDTGKSTPSRQGSEEGGASSCDDECEEEDGSSAPAPNSQRTSQRVLQPNPAQVADGSRFPLTGGQVYFRLQPV
ncbi:hypothetical protein VTN31DRAFT_6885 [Thermomyces dupontii]|uniref:uncharacterized protein n=1 Tax=Talaromyces thermophilus TaxID=28565 RepID=UPI00374224F4